MTSLYITEHTFCYDYAEQLERFYKVAVLGRSGAGLSCIEPVEYRKRFLRRMEELIAPSDNKV